MSATKSSASRAAIASAIRSLAVLVVVTPALIATDAGSTLAGMFGGGATVNGSAVAAAVPSQGVCAVSRAAFARPPVRVILPAMHEMPGATVSTVTCGAAAAVVVAGADAREMPVLAKADIAGY